MLFVTLHVVEAEAVETFHHQHSTGDEFRVRARHHELTLIEIGEHRRHIDHVGGFDSEIEFLADRSGEDLDQRRRVGKRRHRDTADEERRQPRHDPEILVHEVVHRRTLHLHDNRGAVVEGRAVDLCDRRCGDRLPFEGGENGFERRSEVGLDDSANEVERLGRHLVTAGDEFLHQLGGEDALAAGDDLAQLDVGRTERLGAVAHATREVGPAVAAPLAPSEYKPGDERATQDSDDGDRSTDRRHLRWPDQRRQSSGGSGTQGGDVAAPGSGGGIEIPRRRIAEHAEFEVGGGTGHASSVERRHRHANAGRRGVRLSVRTRRGR